MYVSYKITWRPCPNTQKWLYICPDWCASVSWTLIPNWKGHRFVSWAGTLFSPSGEVYKRKLIGVSPSHWCFSTSLSPSLPLFLKIKNKWNLLKNDFTSAHETFDKIKIKVTHYPSKLETYKKGNSWKCISAKPIWNIINHYYYCYLLCLHTHDNILYSLFFLFYFCLYLWAIIPIALNSLFFRSAI